MPNSQLQIKTRPQVQVDGVNHVAPNAPAHFAPTQSPMWHLAGLLNNVASGFNSEAAGNITREEEVSRQVQAKQKAQQKLDDEDEGKSRAEQDHESGTTDTGYLSGASDAARRSYQMTSGALAADQYGRNTQQQLEKDVPVDGDVQPALHQSFQDAMANAPTDPVARRVYVDAITRANEQLKSNWDQRSLTAMQYQTTQNYGASVLSALQGDTKSLTGLGSLYSSAAHLGISPEARDQQVAQAFIAAATGGADPAEMRRLAATAHPDGSPGLYEQPEFRQTLDSAITHAEQVKKAADIKATSAAQVDAMVQFNGQADKGIYNRTAVLAAGQRFGWSPSMMASFGTRAQEAQKKQATALEAQQTLANNVHVLESGDTLAFAGLSAKDREAAIAARDQQVFKPALQALQSGDPQRIAEGAAQVQTGISSMASQGIKSPALQVYFSAYDPSNVKDSEATYHLYAALNSVSPTYLQQHLSGKASAQLAEVDSLIRTQGMTYAQAATTVSANQPLSTESASKLTSDTMRSQGSSIPTEVGGGLFGIGATKIKNPAVYRQQVMANLRANYAMGTFTGSPSDAIKAAVARTNSQGTVVNGMYVGASNLSESQVPAVNQFVTELQDRLQASNRLAPGETIAVQPAPNDPGKLRLVSIDAMGISIPLTSSAAANAPTLSIDPAVLAGHYKGWKAGEDEKQTVLKQAQEATKENAPGVGMAFEDEQGRGERWARWREAAANEKAVEQNPAYKASTFTDYLRNTQ